LWPPEAEPPGGIPRETLGTRGNEGYEGYDDYCGHRRQSLPGAFPAGHRERGKMEYSGFALPIILLNYNLK